MVRLAIILVLLAGVSCGMGCREKSPPPETPATQPADGDRAEVKDIPRIGLTQLRPLAEAPAPPAKPQPAGLTQPTPASRPASTPSPASRPAPADPNDPRTHILAGDEAMVRGDYQAAVACFERARALAPSDLDAMAGLAFALSAAERHERALVVYRAIIAAAPAEVARTAKFNLGVTLMRLRRLGEAEQVFRQLSGVEAADVRSRFNLAICCEAQGKLADARDEWLGVIANSTALPAADRAFAHASLGEVLMNLGRRDKAMEAYAMATKLAPNDAVTWLNLAVAARRCGSLGRAQVAAQKATALAPDNPAAWSLLGDVLLELHRLAGKREFLVQASQAWQKSLALDADQPALRQKLSACQASLAGR